MDDRQKLAAAAAGGYVAGRLKKGRQALRLVLWLSGDTTGPRVVNATRNGAMSLAQSAEVKAIVDQLSGPLREAVQRAAIAAVMGRVTRLSDGLAARTAALNDTAKQVTDTAGDTVQGVTDTAGDTVKGVTDGLTGGSSSGPDDDAPDEESPDDDEQDEQDEQEPKQDEPEQRRRRRPHRRTRPRDDEDDDDSEDDDA